MYLKENMKSKLTFSFIPAIMAALLLCVVSCSTVQLTTQNPEAREFYLKGQSFEKQGELKWRQALDSFKKAAREDKNFFEAYAAMGLLYERQGLNRRAVESYGQAFKIDNRRTDLFLSYGKALFNIEEYQSAFMILQRYVSAYPNDREGLEWLAEAARAVNDPEAEKYFIRLADLDSVNIESWVSLARFYYDEKDYAKAIPVYDRVIKQVKHPMPVYSLNSATAC